MTADPRFLTLAEALMIHADQIRNYGGTYGLLDIRLLSSALAQPEAGYAGAYLHEDLFAMAGAYAYHICQNHPFVDGNKRTALAAALVFLDVNGVVLEDVGDQLYGLMMEIANGKASKQDAVRVFRELAVLPEKSMTIS
ncbi:MAG: type II toxin-antitoxin system death-on-curing family toxin [Patescibacteria group bacterium]